jgi:hypothetical protein
LSDIIRRPPDCHPGGTTRGRMTSETRNAYIAKQFSAVPECQ